MVYLVAKRLARITGGVVPPVAVMVGAEVYPAPPSVIVKEAISEVTVADAVAFVAGFVAPVTLTKILVNTPSCLRKLTGPVVLRVNDGS
jgi:hypothetical protein